MEQQVDELLLQELINKKKVSEDEKIQIMLIIVYLKNRLSDNLHDDLLKENIELLQNMINE